MRKLWWLVPAVAAAAAVVWYHGWQHWLSHGTGSYDTPGVAHHYNAWSGSLSIALPPLITLAGLGLGWWWHNQCGVHRCYWYARKTTDAGDRACWRHHPHRHAHLTHARLLERHRASARRG